MSNEIILGHKVPRTGAPTTVSGRSRIVYRLIDYEIDEKGHINILYVNDNQVPFDDVFEDFLYKIRTELPTGGERLVSSPLDVNCKEECFMVFQLVHAKNWQFGDAGDCFTTKDPEGDKYCDLWHVLYDGTKIPAGEPLPDGCRILYLTARCQDVGFRDGFNLRVDLVLPDIDQEKRRTKLIIDPDIRNPGGSGEPFMAPDARERALAR